MEKIHILRRLPSRLRGLLGRPSSYGTVMIVPCKDVHTLGMAYAIDLAFIGSNGEVLNVYRNVEPGSRLRCGRARAVIERPARPSASWFSQGAFAGLTVKNALSTGIRKGNSYEEMSRL